MTDYFNQDTPEIIDDPAHEQYIQDINARAAMEQQQEVEAKKQAQLAEQKAQQAAKAEADKPNKAEEFVASALFPALGTIDFITDVARFVPGGKGIDDWWDENSPRSSNPIMNGLRDIAGLVIPAMVPGGAIARGATAAAKAAGAAKWAQTATRIGANVGVDVGIAAASETSEKGENLGTLMNDTFGWDVPWAIREGDSPDTKRWKNIIESAGITGGVELLITALPKGLKMIGRDPVADEIVKRDEALKAGDEITDPTTREIEIREALREETIAEEGVRRIDVDPEGTGGYDAFVNEPAEAQARAVQNVEANGLEAKVDHFRIQNNIGTTNGRAISVATDSFQKKFIGGMDDVDRAEGLAELFSTVRPNVNAIINGKTIQAEKINPAIDNLTEAVFKLDLKEFTKFIDNMRTMLYEGQEFLGEEEWYVGAQAFKRAFDIIFDPDKMRASAMLTQNAADNAADASRAAILIGDIADTTRQQEMAFENLELLAGEIRANQYIAGKSLELKKLVKNGDHPKVVAYLANLKDEFAEAVIGQKAKGKKVVDTMKAINKENPEYLKAFNYAYDATNGDVDELFKLQRYAEENIGLIKKAFIDGDPSVPSQVVRGLQAVRYNHVLSGLSAVRAGVGNAVMTVSKPVSVLAGAVASDPTGQKGVLKRALYTYGGIAENMKRAFKHMGQEWRLANSAPAEAMLRGRADLAQSKLENFEVMEAMSEAWRADGKNGKVAMWNFAKVLSWYNNNPFVRYGTNAMYALDGFMQSMMASGVARAKAYDELFSKTRGAFDADEFNKLQRKLYSDSFDESGMLTNKAAKFASSELALNLDNEIVSRLEHLMEKVPFMRSLFMFPRTGVNALELGWSYNPMSGLGLAMGRARKVLSAKTVDEMTEALAEHGLEYTDEAFHSLKSEYVGRQLMGSAVVLGAGLWAAEGNLTGNGPQDAAEKKRMQDIGWKPLSIRNPLSGEWVSYQGLEPFDTLLGLVGDWAFNAERVDQAWSEDIGRKIAYSISMNIANKTFLSGFEPLVSMLSGDEGAWNRFMAMQADSMLPYTGARSLLSKAITPQLKDVENDFFAYLANRNKFLFSGNELLKDQLDIYTGQPINYHEPITAGMNALLPFFKSNGGMEPWRQWLLKTGWDNLQTVRLNPSTGEQLTPEQRQKVNNWIAQNADLKGQIEGMMNQKENFWNSKIKEYVKERGQQTQKEFPIKDLVVHRELDQIHNQAFKMAFAALEQEDATFAVIGGLKKRRSQRLGVGDLRGASDDATQVQELLQIRN